MLSHKIVTRNNSLQVQYIHVIVIYVYERLPMGGYGAMGLTAANWELTHIGEGACLPTGTTPGQPG